MKTRYVAINPKNGLHLRAATKKETTAYLSQRSRSTAFRQPVQVGTVLIDEYPAPGVWFGGAGF